MNMIMMKVDILLNPSVSGSSGSRMREKGEVFITFLVRSPRLVKDIISKEVPENHLLEDNRDHKVVEEPSPKTITRHPSSIPSISLAFTATTALARQILMVTLIGTNISRGTELPQGETGPQGDLPASPGQSQEEEGEEMMMTIQSMVARSKRSSMPPPTI